MVDRPSTDDPPGKAGEKIQNPGRKALPVIYKKDLEIYQDTPLKQYDTGPIKAYAARGTEKFEGNFFVLVCEPSLIPRTGSTSHYANVRNSSLVPLVDKGVVYWPPAAQERQIFIYRDVLGQKILEDGPPAALGWRPEEAMACFIRPMIEILQDFRNRDFVHGSIRATNIYDGGALKKTPIMLGDCLSLPPSWAQPVLYETIPRALASSIGRGQGSLADDIYAFGVTLAVLLRVNDPLAKMSDEEIIRCKIEHSSYIALTGKDRFKGSLLELLRGVLHDQENERWTIDDIMIWLDGRRLSPKQVTRPKKASRALTFMGRKYFFLPFLLADMQAEPSEAVKILENGEMDQWIQRCLENEEAAEEVRLAISHSMTDNKAPGYEHKLMARLRPLLDENAPVQYKNLRLRPDGFGRALAQDLIQKKDPSPFIELVRESTVLSWISARRDKNLDVGALVPKFESCRNFIRNTKIGFGLERCLYELCPEAHCLSDKFTNYLVHNAEEMIRILEKLCKENKAKPLFLDRHSVAFLSVVDPKTIDPFLHDLGTPEKYKYILGNLKCLAAIQKRYDMEPFPSISKAFIEFLAPVYERFHDRVMQQKVKKDVEQFAETGSLIKMLNALANSEIISRDYSSFQAAGAEYAFLLSEEKSLTRELQDRNTFARATGRRISAGIAIAIAIIVISFVSFAFFVNKAPLF